MDKLKQKIAFVTGGNSGIGLAAAKLFATEGARVIISGRDQSTLDQAVALIGQDTLALQGDVAKQADQDGFIQQIRERYGRLDVLFVNAGVYAASPLSETTEEFYDALFNINVKGAFFTIQKAASLLGEGASVIINASTVIHAGASGAGLYAATKAAVRQLARNLANELASRHIRVNVISPGYTRTPIAARAGYNDEQVEGFYKHVSAEVPMRRVGEAEEIAKAVLFLASDDSSYITGEEIVADGGYRSIGAAGVQRS